MSKSVRTIEHLSNVLSESLGAVTGDLKVLRAIMERVESKVDVTNGRVNKLETWKTQQETEQKTRDEIEERSDTNYKAPIITGLTVAGIMLLVGLAVKVLP